MAVTQRKGRGTMACLFPVCRMPPDYFGRVSLFYLPRSGFQGLNINCPFLFLVFKDVVLVLPFVHSVLCRTKPWAVVHLSLLCLSNVMFFIFASEFTFLCNIRLILFICHPSLQPSFHILKPFLRELDLLIFTCTEHWCLKTTRSQSCLSKAFSN